MADSDYEDEEGVDEPVLSDGDDPKDAELVNLFDK